MVGICTRVFIHMSLYVQCMYFHDFQEHKVMLGKCLSEKRIMYKQKSQWLNLTDKCMWNPIQYHVLWHRKLHTVRFFPFRVQLNRLQKMAIHSSKMCSIRDGSTMRKIDQMLSTHALVLLSNLFIFKFHFSNSSNH